MSNGILRKGGWQANIEYFENYVIKTPKSEPEIREKIKKYYTDSADLEIKIKKLQEYWENSIRIVKSGKVPLRFFAYPEFIDNGGIKQKRVKMLSEEFDELMSKNNLKGAKKLVDKVIKFIKNLWSYGVHEITFKFYSEMGLLNEEVVLVDIGELTDDKERIKRQLLKGNKKLEELRKHHHDKVLDYYQDQIKKKLTVKVLDRIWNSKSYPFCIIIRGPLACGKTTVSKELAKKLKANHISIDEILDKHDLGKDREEGYTSQKSFIKANTIAVKEAKKLLEKNKIVIFDGNFYWKSQIEDLIQKLDYPHYVFTLKAPVEVCIARDKERGETHGADATRVVHKKVSSFDYGTIIDTKNQTSKETVSDILSHLRNKK